ncbi:MAG: hypothetical protein F6K21_05685 [Symploca sp. SIO2D2]|nr:hypothetical protein [Symploca sp. SIO2D2]
MKGAFYPDIEERVEKTAQAIILKSYKRRKDWESLSLLQLYRFLEILAQREGWATEGGQETSSQKDPRFPELDKHLKALESKGRAPLSAVMGDIVIEIRLRIKDSLAQGL